MHAISNFEIMLEQDAPASGIEEAQYIQNVEDEEEEIILED